MAAAPASINLAAPAASTHILLPLPLLLLLLLLLPGQGPPARADGCWAGWGAW
jgi:hypothetical protein